jgi:methionyl-tRNA formyltransferase
MSLRIIFAGTPKFAVSALNALLQNKFEIIAVLTQPDRTSGRGMQLKQSPVKQLAMQNGLMILQPETLKTAEIQKQLTAYEADLMVVAAYGIILPLPVLEIPRYGCLNIHASILPRWRGAAPIQRAIQAGDERTGITIMQMDAGLDTGDILLKKTCTIESQDTADTLHDRLANLGAEAIKEALVKLEQGKLHPIPQDNSLSTYATKLNKEEARIDWSRDAVEIDRDIRAYNPYPGAGTLINNTHVKIWQAKINKENGRVSGEVIEAQKNALVVACGKGSLRIEILQRPNAKAMSAGEFLQGFQIKAGDRFSSN